MNAKKYHILVGLLLIVFGLVCTGFSVLQYIKPEHTVDKLDILKQEATTCKTKAITAGFNASFNDDLLVITSKRVNILDNPTPEIYKSSILISQCDKLQVKEFCLGAGCMGQYQKEFVLTFQLTSKMKDPVRQVANPITENVGTKK